MSTSLRLDMAEFPTIVYTSLNVNGIVPSAFNGNDCLLPIKAEKLYFINLDTLLGYLLSSSLYNLQHTTNRQYAALLLSSIAPAD